MTAPGESDQNRKVDTSVMGGGWRRSKEGGKYIFIYFVGGGGLLQVSARYNSMLKKYVKGI